MGKGLTHGIKERPQLGVKLNLCKETEWNALY